MLVRVVMKKRVEAEKKAKKAQEEKEGKEKEEQENDENNSDNKNGGIMRIQVKMRMK